MQDLKFRHECIEKYLKEKAQVSVAFYQHCVYVSTLVNKNSFEILEKMLEYKPFADEVAEWRMVGEQYILLKNEIETIKWRPFGYDTDVFCQAEAVLLDCLENLGQDRLYWWNYDLPINEEEHEAGLRQYPKEVQKDMQLRRKKGEEWDNEIINSIIEKYEEKVKNLICKFLKTAFNFNFYEGSTLRYVIFSYIDPFGLEEGIKRRVLELYKECLFLHYSLLYNNK